MKFHLYWTRMKKKCGEKKRSIFVWNRRRCSTNYAFVWLQSMCTFTHSLRKRFVVSLSYLNGLFRFSRHKIPSIHDHSQCTRCVACFNVLWSFISPSFRTCARVNGTPLSSKSGYIRGDAQLVTVFFCFFFLFQWIAFSSLCIGPVLLFCIFCCSLNS